MAPRTFNIRDLNQLQRFVEDVYRDRVVSRTTVDDAPEMQTVLDTFPVRITEHLYERMKRSDAVAKQYLPDVREITTLEGQERCFTGLFPTNIEGLERMYVDRCIIMPQPACPAYCRFCFRKFYEHADGHAMSDVEMDRAIAYVAADPRLREVLITGGEPVMDFQRLTYVMRGLRQIDHLGPIRIACRSVVMAPYLVTDRLIAMLREHHDLRRGKPVEVAIHVNHPDELDERAIEAIVRFRDAGIHVYNQTVLLRDINCDAEVLLSLFRKLRNHGVESYYLFFGGPVQGMNHSRPTIDEALTLMTTLRRTSTGRCLPRFILTTRIGKVTLGVDGWIVEREADGLHVWIRTPYTLRGFREISAEFQLPEDGRIDEEGHIVMRYLDGSPQT